MARAPMANAPMANDPMATAPTAPAEYLKFFFLTCFTPENIQPA
jgi:hypothetical protein